MILLIEISGQHEIWQRQELGTHTRTPTDTQGNIDCPSAISLRAIKCQVGKNVALRWGGGYCMHLDKIRFMLRLKRFHRNVKDSVKIDCEYCGFTVETMLNTLKSCARTKRLAFSRDKYREFFKGSLGLKCIGH